MAWQKDSLANIGQENDFKYIYDTFLINNVTFTHKLTQTLTDMIFNILCFYYTELILKGFTPCHKEYTNYLEHPHKTYRNCFRCFR